MPRDAQLQAWGGKPEAAASLLLPVLVWGTSERLVPAKKKRTPGTSERFVANSGVGPSTRGQGDSASLVQRR